MLSAASANALGVGIENRRLAIYAYLERLFMAHDVRDIRFTPPPAGTQWLNQHAAARRDIISLLMGGGDVFIAFGLATKAMKLAAATFHAQPQAGFLSEDEPLRRSSANILIRH